MTSSDPLSPQGSVDPHHHSDDALCQKIIDCLNTDDWNLHQVYPRAVVNYQVTHLLVPRQVGVNRKGHPTKWDPHQEIHFLSGRECYLLTSNYEALQISSPHPNKILNQKLLRPYQREVEEIEWLACCQVSLNTWLCSHCLP
jgi:hypothetical protein